MPTDDLETYLHDELVKQFAPKFEAAARRLLPQVRQTVGEAMVASRHYQSLLSGSLQRVFALPEPGPLVDAVVAAVQRSVRVAVTPADRDTLGGFDVGAFAADFSDALGAAGPVVNLNKVDVDWLRILLFGGDAVLSLTPPRSGGFGRQNPRLGQNRYASSGPVVRVPPQFAGYPAHNWLTEVAETVRPQVGAMVEAELRRF